MFKIIIMKIKKLKKSVTPIIAVIMLLLITLSLAGMAMVIFNQLGKQSETQIRQQMAKMNIRGEIRNAIADPNQKWFNFTIINRYSRKLPIDGENTELRIYFTATIVIRDIICITLISYLTTIFQTCKRNF